MARRRKQPDRVDREVFLRELLREAWADLEAARKAGQATAVSVLMRQVREVRRDLDDLLEDDARENGDAIETATDEELVEMTIEALVDLPAHLLEPIAAICATRLGPVAMARIMANPAGLRVIDA